PDPVPCRGASARPSARCTSTAQRTAFTTVWTSMRRPSPVVLIPGLDPGCGRGARRSWGRRVLGGSPSVQRACLPRPRPSAAISRRHRLPGSPPTGAQPARPSCRHPGLAQAVEKPFPVLRAGERTGEAGTGAFRAAISRFLFRVAADVLKRQNRDRRLVGYRRRRRRRRIGVPANWDAIDTHRPGNVFDVLLAEILECEIELVTDLVAHDPADADSAGLGQGFEAGGDIDAVAINVALVDDDVAEVDADAELYPFVGRHVGVAPDHFALDLDGIAHRIDDAGELGQEAVAGGLDDAAPVLGDLGVAELAPYRRQRDQGAFLVGAHQPRIAGDIGRQDRRQPALDPLPGHLSA